MAVYNSHIALWLSNQVECRVCRSLEFKKKTIQLFGVQEQQWREVTADSWHSGRQHRQRIACTDVLHELDVYKVQSGSCRGLREYNTASLNEPDSSI